VAQRKLGRQAGLYQSSVDQTLALHSKKQQQQTNRSSDELQTTCRQGKEFAVRVSDLSYHVVATIVLVLTVVIKYLMLL